MISVMSKITKYIGVSLRNFPLSIQYSGRRKNVYWNKVETRGDLNISSHTVDQNVRNTQNSDSDLLKLMKFHMRLY